MPVIGPLSSLTSASITVSHCMVKVCQSISQSPVSRSTDNAVNNRENWDISPRISLIRCAGRYWCRSIRPIREIGPRSRRAFFLYWSVLNAEKKVGHYLGSSIGLWMYRPNLQYYSRRKRRLSPKSAIPYVFYRAMLRRAVIFPNFFSYDSRAVGVKTTRCWWMAVA